MELGGNKTMRRYYPPIRERSRWEIEKDEREAAAESTERLVREATGSIRKRDALLASDRKLVCALHEGGHTITSAVMRLPVHEVYIEQTAEGLWRGFFAHTAPSGLPELSDSQREKNLVAGCPQTERARRAFMPYLTTYCAGHVVQTRLCDDHATQRVNCSGDCKDIAAILSATCGDDQEERDAMLAEAVETAKDIINRYWSCIEEIARELYVRLRLDRDEIGGILARHNLVLPEAKPRKTKPAKPKKVTHKHYSSDEAPVFADNSRRDGFIGGGSRRRRSHAYGRAAAYWAAQRNGR
jgi:hypothetical protein